VKFAKFVLSFVLSLSIFSSSLFAEMVDTREMLHQSAKVDVNGFLAKKEVEDKLAALGVDKGALKERIASLTSDEIAQINAKIDQMPAGGDAGAIVGVLAFIFVLLVVTDILGLTKVFTFTRSIR
jgi:hypothetical protein